MRIVIFPLLLSLLGSAHAQQFATATIVMTDGTRYDVLEFSRHCLYDFRRENLSIVRPGDNLVVEIPTSQVDMIQISGLGERRRFGGSAFFSPVEGEMLLSNGNSIPLGIGSSLTRILVDLDKQCTIDILDDFTGVRQTIPFRFDRGDGVSVALIDFTGIGSVKWSPTSDRVFPSSYSFDPFTGTQLLPISPDD